MASSGSIERRLVRRICDCATETAAAAKHLTRHGVVWREEIEPPPAEMKAFWVKSPSGIIQLISKSVKARDAASQEKMMKYICLGYYDEKTWETMSES
jgi:hypothetical protein